KCLACEIGRLDWHSGCTTRRATLTFRAKDLIHPAARRCYLLFAGRAKLLIDVDKARIKAQLS
ncbi:MAG TPA: hypothetical protein VHR39_14405, partial [Propionibacteriaceae bacterium]|nr:hypothetical protein [Propionibacteriaceae bacterium]